MMANINNTIKVVLYVFIIFAPFSLILGFTFKIVGEKNKDKPDILSCNSFKGALRRAYPLHVTKEIFSKEMENMCQCFNEKNKNKNKNKEPRGYVTYNSLELCSKNTILSWLKVVSVNDVRLNPKQVSCIKEGIYNDIIYKEIMKSQDLIHSGGVFRNDLFYYTWRDQKREEVIKKCLL